MAQRSDERIDFLNDVVIGFAEDYGTNYWRQIDDYDLTSPEKVWCTFHAVEDDPTVHKVDMDVIATGIGRILRGQVRINSELFELTKRASQENWAGDIDAYLADAIAQAGVYNEIIYG